MVGAEKVCVQSGKERCPSALASASLAIDCCQGREPATNGSRREQLKNYGGVGMQYSLTTTMGHELTRMPKRMLCCNSNHIFHTLLPQNNPRASKHWMRAQGK